jgi:predicted O-methyltransferase YrrM
MPSLSGIWFRAKLACNAFTKGMHIYAYPTATTSPFDFFRAVLPELPILPPELAAALQPEAGSAKVIESSEPEVSRTLYTWAALAGATRIVEVGVFRGFTSQFLAAAASLRGGELHLVDMSRSALDESAGRAAAYPGCTVRTHCGMSTDPAVLATVPGECDLIFLDADHSETGVLAELDVWAPKVRPNGVIAIHDTVNIGGVCRAANRWTNRCAAVTFATNRGSGLTLLAPHRTA